MATYRTHCHWDPHTHTRAPTVGQQVCKGSPVNSVADSSLRTGRSRGECSWLWRFWEATCCKICSTDNERKTITFCTNSGNRHSHMFLWVSSPFRCPRRFCLACLNENYVIAQLMPEGGGSSFWWFWDAICCNICAKENEWKTCMFCTIPGHLYINSFCGVLHRSKVRVVFFASQHGTLTLGYMLLLFAVACFVRCWYPLLCVFLLFVIDLSYFLFISLTKPTWCSH